MYHRLVVASAFSGEVSEPAEGARLLSEYTGLNLYRGFKSLPLRHLEHFCFENAPGVKRSETPPRPLFSGATVIHLRRITPAEV